MSRPDIRRVSKRVIVKVTSYSSSAAEYTRSVFNYKRAVLAALFFMVLQLISPLTLFAANDTVDNIVSTSPTLLATDVVSGATTSTVTFSKEVVDASATIDTIKVKKYDGTDITTGVAIDVTHLIVSISHNPLVSNTEYYYWIDGTDGSGLQFADNLYFPETWADGAKATHKFQTLDVVTSFSPTANAVDVDVESNPTITFTTPPVNTPENLAKIAVRRYENDSEVAAVKTVLGNIITLTLTMPKLDWKHSYYYTIESDFTFIDGEIMNESYDSTTTGVKDLTKFTTKSVFISWENMRAVDSGGFKVYVRGFSAEDYTTVLAPVNVYTYSDDSLVYSSIDNIASRYVNSGITPYFGIAWANIYTADGRWFAHPGTKYYVTIGEVQDASNYNRKTDTITQADKETYWFQFDGFGDVVSSPEFGSTSANISQNITITIPANSITNTSANLAKIKLRKYSDDSIVSTTNVLTASNEVTMVLSSSLDYETRYYVSIDSSLELSTYRFYENFGITEAEKALHSFTTKTPSLEVILTGTGGGDIVSFPAGITVTDDGDDNNDVTTYSFDLGTTVQLFAKASVGSVFTGWGIGCSGNNYCEIEFNLPTMLTATFNASTNTQYGVSVTEPTNGSIISSPSGIYDGSYAAHYDEGTEVSLTALPDEGYRFASWGGACTAETTDTCVITVTAVTATSVTFEQIPSYTLSVTTAGEGTGVVTSSPSGIDTGSVNPSTFDFLEDTSVTLTAVADSSMLFSTWSGGACDGSTSTTCVVSMTQATNVTATFIIDPVDLTPPVISGISVVKTMGTATVSFSTDEDARCWVDYGKTSNYGIQSSESSLIRNHSVDLWDMRLILEPGTRYYFEIVCRDDDSNMSTSPQQEFTTDEGYTLYLQVDGSGAHMIQYGNNGEAILQDYSSYDDLYSVTTIYYPKGSTAPLHNVGSVNGSIFMGWGGDCRTLINANDCNLTMNGNKSVTMTFRSPDSVDPDIKPGTTSVTKNGITVEFVGGFEGPTTTAILTIIEKQANSRASVSGKQILKIIDITAVDQNDINLTNGFNSRITIPYTGAKAGDTVMYWNGSTWATNGISDVVVDINASTISFTTNHFSEFGIFSNTTDGVVLASTDGPSQLPVTGTDALKIFLNLIMSIIMVAGLIVVLNRTKYSTLLA